jgi:hypothetical protein
MKLWNPIFAVSKKKTPAEITHPDYATSQTDWTKFRETYVGGKKFVNKYLKKFSLREDNPDFTNRKDISYCPAHAKAALIDIKNSIYQRMFEVTRTGGDKTYQDAIKGLEGGVDLEGRTMTNFIGTLALPELISMGKVGIYVDKFPMPDNPTRANTQSLRPYIYHYPTEDIRSWTFQDSVLTSLLLRDYVEEVDVLTGLVTGVIEKYRHLRLTDAGVTFQMYDSEGKADGPQAIMKLAKIPFAIGRIFQSLLTDVADYQIALLNLESSDIAYSLQSNFPFYTEQFDPRMVNVKKVITTAEEDGQPKRENVTDSGNPDVKVGVTKGRAYPKGFDRPGFIHPSGEPLRVSMEKQAKLKQDIRKLINLSLSNLERPSGSEPSRELDVKGLEAGLSYIGLELEKLEREVATIWADYQKGDIAEIKYPEDYTLKTDADRRIEAKELTALKETVPSQTYQRELSKEIVTVTMEQKISSDNLAKMHSEIDQAEVLVTDHETIREDHKEGLVSSETASLAMGYPKGDVEKAKTDHADRAAAIATAQKAISDRGADDLQNTDDADLDKQGKDVRGKGNTDE